MKRSDEFSVDNSASPYSENLDFICDLDMPLGEGKLIVSAVTTIESDANGAPLTATHADSHLR